MCVLVLNNYHSSSNLTCHIGKLAGRSDFWTRDSGLRYQCTVTARHIESLLFTERNNRIPLGGEKKNVVYLHGVSVTSPSLKQYRNYKIEQRQCERIRCQILANYKSSKSR